MKVIFIPGNGGGGPKDNWFPYLKEELEKLKVTVVASEFPDNYLARESYWLPFIKDHLQADEKTILIGHSSGAIAAMRFAETNKLIGSVLVGAYHTDLGLSMEKQSGYFDRPWDWKSIVRNQKWIIQFASISDPWIPIEEARFVHDRLGTEYHEFLDQGHFGSDSNKLAFPELLEAVKLKIKGFIMERDLGEQPLTNILKENNLSPDHLVKASTDQITFKMVSRACKGRKLSPHVKEKILKALNSATGKIFTLPDIFSY